MSLKLSVNRIRSIHWVYNFVIEFEDYDDFICMVDQREAEMMKWT